MFDIPRNRESERAAFAGLRLHPDPSAVPIDDLLADREADAGARVLGLRVEPLEHHEDPFGVLRIEADAIVRDREDGNVGAFLARHVDARRAFAPELHRIANEVLEELGELL